MLRNFKPRSVFVEGGGGDVNVIACSVGMAVSKGLALSVLKISRLGKELTMISKCEFSTLQDPRSNFVRDWTFERL